MKKVLYSALAAVCAIAGVAASKANGHRVNNIFKYIGPANPASPNTVTATLNWTLVSSVPTACTGSNYACDFTTTVAPHVIGSGSAQRQVPAASLDLQAQQTPSLSFTILPTASVPTAKSQN